VPSCDNCVRRTAWQRKKDSTWVSQHVKLPKACWRAFGIGFRGRKADSSNEKPQRGILIIGSNGTGKTTLAHFLSGRLNWFDQGAGSYQESLGLEEFLLSDDSGIEMIVAPGQAFRRPSTWPELKAQVATGAFRGVVVVNAYGYHNFSTRSYKSHELYKGSKPEFWDVYRANRREEELRVLRELVLHLSVCPQKLWLMSVVAKQDLWDKQQRAVEEHYFRGDYAQSVFAKAGRMGHEFLCPLSE
jgi:hypothetical protein